MGFGTAVWGGMVLPRLPDNVCWKPVTIASLTASLYGSRSPPKRLRLRCSWMFPGGDGALTSANVKLEGSGDGGRDGAIRGGGDCIG